MASLQEKLEEMYGRNQNSGMTRISAPTSKKTFLNSADYSGIFGGSNALGIGAPRNLETPSGGTGFQGRSSMTQEGFNNTLSSLVQNIVGGDSTASPGASIFDIVNLINNQITDTTKENIHGTDSGTMKDLLTSPTGIYTGADDFGLGGSDAYIKPLLDILGSNEGSGDEYIPVDGSEEVTTSLPTGQSILGGISEGDYSAFGGEDYSGGGESSSVELSGNTEYGGGDTTSSFPIDIVNTLTGGNSESILAAIIQQAIVDSSVKPTASDKSSKVAISDKELKENIELVGNSPSGINIYEFDYKNKVYGEGRYRGVMAQEVPKSSFKSSNGYLMVDYSNLDVDFERID